MKTSRKSVVLAILAGLLGCAFLSHEANAQNGLQPVQSLSIVDANGKKVGTVLGFAEYLDRQDLPIVAFRVDRKFLVLRVDRDKFLGSHFTRYQNFQFESGDCTGTPLTDVFDVDAVTVSRIHILLGAQVFTPDGPVRTVRVRSVRSGSQCGSENFDPRPMMPWRLLIDLNTQFQAPFTMQ